MSRVPTYGGSQVRMNPLPGAREAGRQASEDPASLGAGVGATIAQGGLVMNRELIAHQQDELLRQDQARVVAAEASVSQWELDTIIKGPDAALQQYGINAFGVPDKVQKSWEEKVGPIREALSNDRQKLAFDRAIAGRKEAIDRQVNAHVMGQMRAVEKQSNDSYIENSYQMAVANANDPERVAAEIDNSRVHAGLFAQTSGMDAETTKRYVASVTSNIHEGVIDRLTATGQYVKAKNYFDAAKDEIDVRKVNGLRDGLEVSGVRAQSHVLALNILSGKTAGMIEPGNIDLGNRPQVKTPDGRIATVRSIGIEEDGKYVLIPTVSHDGEIMDNDAAIAYYRKTGEFLGKFNSEEASDHYAEVLHQRQERMVNGGSGEPTLPEILDETDKIENDQVRDATVARVKERYAVNRQNQADQSAAENAAHRTAVDTAYANATDAVTATHLLSAIKPMDWAAMTPEMQKSTTAYAKTLSEGKKVETDLGLFLPLIKMAGNPVTAQEFAKIDFNAAKYLNTISASDRIKMTELQATIMKGTADDLVKAIHPLRTMDQMVDSVLLSRGIDPNRRSTDSTIKDPAITKQIDALWMRLEEAVAAKKREAKRDFLTSAEQQEIVDRIHIEDAQNFYFAADKPLTIDLSAPGATVGGTDRTLAIQILREKGMDITEANIRGVVSGRGAH